MKIRSIDSFLLSSPFDPPIQLPYFGGDRTLYKRDAMLIRVEADNGLVGWAPGQPTEHTKQVIDQVIEPFLTDHHIGDPDALRILFLRGPGKDHQVARIYCSVELAFYDLLGKAHAAPVSEFIGGRIRDRIRVYGSAGMYMSPEAYADEAAAIAGLGFRAYKMRPAAGPEEDLRTIQLIRKAMGQKVDIMVDAHTWWRMGDKSYSPREVEDLARAFGDLEVAWLEEPLPPHDHEAYRRLKDMNLLPIAAGEHEPNDEQYLDLILTNSVDYVQMDIVCQGGYPTGRRILPEIEQAGLRFAFHSFGTALEVLAAAHLGICYPETLVDWLEYPCYRTPVSSGMYPFPLAADVLKEPLNLEHGELVVPREPGWGMDINEKAIEQYPWIPGPWSTFRLHSPAQTFEVTGDHSYLGRQP
ncbi:MAG TPA: mandelate racemase/muconate lactonizing enzyme family protein [Bryobacteraceae bacterium]|jgi:L-alanine-DL-glutamate epimerase-like enolase superfamily enzyme|nr:mandelate racemase/muconate lactonizing enzyme family protein [Bryobacteraceae bacterium]